MISVKQKQT